MHFLYHFLLFFRVIISHTFQIFILFNSGFLFNTHSFIRITFVSLFTLVFFRLTLNLSISVIRIFKFFIPRFEILFFAQRYHFTDIKETYAHIMTRSSQKISTVGHIHTNYRHYIIHVFSMSTEHPRYSIT
jgi:hypothetical protein